jgi:hypothetical protein
MAIYTTSEAEKLWHYIPLQTDLDMRFREVYGNEMINRQLQVSPAVRSFRLKSRVCLNGHLAGPSIWYVL